MNMPFANAGTKLEISTELPETYDKAGYDALSWTQVKGVRIIGDIGKSYKTNTYHAFGMRMPTQKKYGPAEGSNNIEIILVDDRGQEILLESIDGGAHSYRVKKPNEKALCFTATTSSVMEGVGNAQSAADAKLAINYTTPPIKV